MYHPTVINMVAIREFRVIMPFTIDEYQIGHLYTIQKMSAKESDNEDGDGVEVLKNEPFEDAGEGGRKGQFTHKIYHISKKLPAWVTALAPKNLLMLEERAWNAYPHCLTTITSPYFTRFKLEIESLYAPDRAEQENPLKLSEEKLEARVVDNIDIAFDEVEKYVEEEDPTKYTSSASGKGPLQKGWRETCTPVMTAYKLVTVDMPYWGVGPRLEKYISKQLQRKVHLESNRKLFCWQDQWLGLSIADIRRKEQETFSALNKKLAAKAKNGVTNGDQAKEGEFGTLPA